MQVLLVNAVPGQGIRCYHILRSTEVILVTTVSRPPELLASIARTLLIARALLSILTRSTTLLTMVVMVVPSLLTFKPSLLAPITTLLPVATLLLGITSLAPIATLLPIATALLPIAARITTSIAIVVHLLGLLLGVASA
jgi:hypothetical protein